jgi:hypothetical protein
MKGYIDSYNFAELDCQKYWQPPASWSKEKRKQETVNRIFSGSWLGARKVDGALYVFLKDEDGNITLRGRAKSVSGEYIDKWDHLPHLHTWAAALPNGCCFLGEVYWDGHEGSNNTTSIMNCLTKKAIERQEKDENKLHYYIFDVLAYDGKSWLNKPAKERFSGIVDCMNSTDRTTSWWHYIEGAHYESGQELWDMLQDLLANDYEGIVITKEDALYEPGKRPSKTTLKIKKELRESIDCFFTGRVAAPTQLYTGKNPESWTLWVNTVTDERLPVGEHYYDLENNGLPIIPVTKPYYYGWAGSLEIAVLDGDKEVSLGYISGLPDEVKMNYKDYTHTVVEIGGMQFDKKSNRLRHGKVIRFRTPEEKIWRNCTYDQLESL